MLLVARRCASNSGSYHFLSFGCCDCNALEIQGSIAFIGIVILLLTRTMDLKHAVEFMNLDAIIFLSGMMVVVALL